MSFYDESREINRVKNKGKKLNLRREYKILIVDDDVNMAEMLKDFLFQRGHRVSVVNESITCIGKCQNNFYDIIFVDFYMKNLNGVELVDIIKNACQNKSLIFAFTGNDSSDALSQFKNVGMNGAIIKPINIDILEKFMNSLELRYGLDERIIKTIDKKRIRKNLFIF